MAEATATLALYRRLIGAQLRSQLQYRISFALDLGSMFLVSFLDFVAVLVIFHNVPLLAGWDVGEVAFLYAMSSLSFSIADLAVGQLDGFAELIRSGNFDLMLARPVGTLFQVIAADFALRRVGATLQGFVVLAYALTLVDIDWTPLRPGLLLVTIASGATIFAAIWVFVICITFWAVESKEFTTAFTYGGHYLTQFPLDVYSIWMRRFLCYFLPLAFVCYLPALYILDRPTALGLPDALRFAAAPVAIIAALAARTMWSISVRHYRSAGG